MRFRKLTVLVLLTPAIGLLAQSKRLQLGKSISGNLSGEQTYSYAIRAKPKQFLRLTVTQISPSVKLVLYAPDGTKNMEVDTRGLRSKPTRILWTAPTGGDYRLKVIGPRELVDAHRYEILLAEQRKAVADDLHRVEAERIFMQALNEARTGSATRAIVSYERALTLYEKVGDREREADTLTAAGDALDDIGQSDKAVGYHERALAIFRAIKDRRGEQIALKNLGVVCTMLDQYERALSLQEQALTIARELKDRNSEGRILNNIGVAYMEMSQMDKAIGYYEQGLEIAREVKDPQFESGSLYALGALYEGLSDYEKAIGYFEQTLAIARVTKDRRSEGDSLTALGWNHTLLGRYKTATTYYEQSLGVNREIKNRRSEGWTLIDVGITYADLGDYQNSIGYFEQALAIDREIKDRRGEATAIGDLGWSYSRLNQYQKAIGYFEQALKIGREIKNRHDEASATLNLGWCYFNLKEYEKAKDYSEQALEIARAIKDRQTESRALNDLGGAYLVRSQYEKAVASYVGAVVISREVKDRQAEIDGLTGLMRVWQTRREQRLATFYGKQAVNVLQSIRSDIRDLGPELQRSFLTDNEKPYHTLAEILIGQGRLPEAEQVLALLKEEEYFQYIRRDSETSSSLKRRTDFTSDEAAYEKRYREIGDSLMTIGVERGNLLAKKTLTTEQSQHLLQIEQDLTAANHAFERFLTDLTRHFSAKPEMTGRIETLRETQAIMEDLREMPPGTVAIFTLIGDDKFHTILRTPDAQKAYEYPIKAGDLNRKIAEFRRTIQNPDLDPRPLAQELYQILISGMAEDLRQAKAETLMWSLDGALRYIPLAALYDGKQYLIELYRISVMTLASNARLKDVPDQRWKAAGFGVTKGYDDASALPSVEAELSGVLKILGGEMKLDDQFTQQSMRQTLLKRYPVVHIASHFRFQPGDGTKSFLLLGDGGHLSLAELKTSVNLFGGVQLLTLSACNTGVGDGAEVEGFGTLAQRQGAKAVIASLWPVADESTSQLMQVFYRIRESSATMTKLEALREAQLALLRGQSQAKPTAVRDRGTVPRNQSGGGLNFLVNPSAPFAHPYYWAPFFLMGNWL